MVLYRACRIARGSLASVLLAITCALSSALSADQNIWSLVSDATVLSAGGEHFFPSRHLTVRLNSPALQDVLNSVQKQMRESPRWSNTLLPLPFPDGRIERFRIAESPVMEPGLSAKYPMIRTYSGQGVDDPAATVRLDVTGFAFHAMVISPNGTMYIDPWSRGDQDHYICYYRGDLYKEGYELTRGWTCTLVAEPDIVSEIRQLVASRILVASGSQLRTYRLACAATGEYTQYFGGTVQQGLSAIVTAVNRVTGIYEREVAVRLILVENNDLLVSTNASHDPYTNDRPLKLLTENQANIDAVIGNANYDIGHVFSTAGGGLAGLGVVCRTGIKAEGETGLPNPVGDAFYVDYVAHEMGHQFGANHSFNGSTGSCGGANRNASTAYEPGSGSTIMSYAGICSPQDLQLHSDPYFHGISFDEIVAYTTVGSANCPTPSSTGNNPPSVNAGLSGFTIPKSTPFRLTGSASDADEDLVTYCWEEFDLGPAGAPDAPSGDAPILRSFNPVSTPTRVFPQLSDILTNTTTIGEILPSYTRTLNFRLTARDNRNGGGGVNYAAISCTVSGSAGPFVVTSPNSAVIWHAQSQHTVTWNVASTDVEPVSCSAVNILLSTDGGQTFSLPLASSTPNDGSESIVLPDIRTANARIMVEAVGNVFFDISNADFTIDAPVPVQLVSFTAQLSAVNTVFLEWKTLSEINNYGFFIQRGSEHEGDYYDIPGSFVPGHGTTIVPQEYSFIDSTDAPGIRYYRLKQIDLDNTIHFSKEIQLKVLADVRAAKIPMTVSLEQNHPNPFNPSTVIRFGLPVEARVRLDVFNLLGERVATVVDDQRKAGFFAERFDGTGIASGVYLYRLTVVPVERRGAVDGEGSTVPVEVVQTRKFLLLH